MNYPANITFGTVHGRFLVDTLDTTSDAGREPDFPALVGTVIFTPNIARIVNPTESVTIARAPIRVELDDDGYLWDGTGRGVQLIATDNPVVEPTGWGYQVSFNLRTPAGEAITLPQIFIKIPAGAMLDLSTVVPVDPTTPESLTQSEINAAAAAQSASAAAQSALEAGQRRNEMIINGWLENNKLYLESIDGAVISAGDLAPGIAGASAYEIAVNDGFTGTESEWIESLKGRDGDPGGPPGPSAYQVATGNGFTGTESEWLKSLKGQDGTNAVQPQFTVGTVTDSTIVGASVTGSAVNPVLNFQFRRGAPGDRGERGYNGDMVDVESDLSWAGTVNVTLPATGGKTFRATLTAATSIVLPTPLAKGYSVTFYLSGAFDVRFIGARMAYGLPPGVNQGLTKYHAESDGTDWDVTVSSPNLSIPTGSVTI